MKNKKDNKKSSRGNVNSIFSRWESDSSDLSDITINGVSLSDLCDNKSTKTNSKKGER